MALQKQTYIDNETVITADQMNAIQDAVIACEEDIVKFNEDLENLPGGADVLVDEVTGVSYKLKVRNGKLMMEEV